MVKVTKSDIQLVNAQILVRVFYNIIHNMDLLVRLMVITATTAVLSINALREGDHGVCEKSETSSISEVISTRISYAMKYETCTLGLFCRTKYRTAYRTTTRTSYRMLSSEILVCCEGFFEIDDGCKPKVPSTLPMTSSVSSSISYSSTPTASSHETTESTHQALSTDLENISTLPMRNIVAKPLPLTTKMMISGFIIIPVFLILILFIMILVSRKKRKLPRSPQRSQDDSNDGTMNQDEHLHNEYYSISSTNQAQNTGQSSATVSPVARESPSHPKIKEKTLSPLSVFYQKINKNKTKEADHQQEEEEEDVNVVATFFGKTELQEDSHYYTNMDKSPPGNVSEGYTEMRGSTTSVGSNLQQSYTDMRGDEVYNEMDNPDHTEDGAFADYEHYNQLETKGKELSKGDGSYDVLTRTDSLLQGIPMAEQNPYDVLGSDEPGRSDTYGIGGGGGRERSPHQSPDGQSRDVHEDANPNEMQIDTHSESVYYNTPEETARNRMDSSQEGIYTNVS
ncbi:uncharacterized protein [Apostichopus japonicus]|uniref:uncharacterized protein isoform X2 n=1 Tax=Stichopus japonicus TaxID=307972 RepID=UPI003AB90E6C